MTTDQANFRVVIPARYASTRLPGKMLLDIAGKPMIAHVVDRANESQATQVIVATDDQRIAEALLDCPCEVLLTRDDHQSGTDRLAEVVDLAGIANDEVIVNVQGDEPLIPGELIDDVALALLNSTNAVMSTAAKAIKNDEDLNDPNVVKVVINKLSNAMYFSRSTIPFARNERQVPVWHHLGIYAYKASFLRRYPELESSALEQIESLEQLRVLDNDENIAVTTVEMDVGFGVDTQADLDRIRELFGARL